MLGGAAVYRCDKGLLSESALQIAEKVEILGAAPKGAADCEALAASLKRYPDTKPSFSANCLAAAELAVDAIRGDRSNRSPAKLSPATFH
jgi:hypothetical protein